MTTFNTIAYYVASCIALVSCVCLARTVLVGVVQIISTAFVEAISPKQTEDVEA